VLRVADTPKQRPVTPLPDIYSLQKEEKGVWYLPRRDAVRLAGQREFFHRKFSSTSTLSVRTGCPLGQQTSAVFS